MKNIQLGIMTALAIVCGVGGAVAKPISAVEFGFAVNDNVPKDSRVIREGQDGCGTVAYANVSKIPSLKANGYLIPDKVVEIDRNNRVLRRWPKPLGDEVLAIEGKRILISTGEAKSYWIDTAGNFQLQSKKIKLKPPTIVQESAVKHPEFKNSSYARLWKYLDQNGKIHRLVYEGACT